MSLWTPNVLTCVPQAQLCFQHRAGEAVQAAGALPGVPLIGSWL